LVFLQDLKGTGLYGGITSKDLKALKPAEKSIANPAEKSTANPTEKSTSTETSPKDSTEKPAEKPASPFVDVPVTRIRAVIAKRLLESKLTIPHYYISVDINMDAALEMRAKFNKLLEKDKIRLSVNDIIIKATAMACKKVPDGNTAWLGNMIRQ
jgi:pyruvate dehydrogenase E2 component (dihydrolipoamide acetyltransferase)